jgi:hypothetical protein
MIQKWLWFFIHHGVTVCGLARRQFLETLRTNPTQLKQEGARLKSFCFCEPTEELIGHVFSLD